MDHLLQVTAPNNSITAYQYNAWGDVTKLESPDSGVSTYGYDAAGNLASQIDANNNQTSYGYDARNRMLTIDYEGDGFDVSVTYDEGQFGAGKPTTILDGSGSTTLDYNEQGQVVKNIANIAGLQFDTDYQYNDFDQLARISYPSGLTIDYFYDDFGRLTAIDKGAGGISQNLMSNADWRGSQLGSYQLGNGIVAERSYDSSGNLVEKRYGSGYIFTSSLDNQGNVVQQDRVMGGGSSASVFKYNFAGHLITDADSSSSEDLFFTYDSVGNRLSRSSSGGSVDETYNYQQVGNRLNDINAVTIQYDAAGNILDDGIRSYQYNSMNRLQQVSLSTLNIPNTYSYNYLGQRVRKQLSDNQATNIRYVYGLDGELLGEYGSSGNRIREYVYYSNGSSQELVAQIEADGTVIYIHTDHLSTPRSATDQNQNIVWAWLSDAFGEASVNEDFDGDGVLVTVNHRFPGQYFDAETGLHYNWHRYYDPETGRYITADPIGLAGGINFYAYVGNDPVNFVDPWGLANSPGEYGGQYTGGTDIKGVIDSYGGQQTLQNTANSSWVAVAGAGFVPGGQPAIAVFAGIGAVAIAAERIYYPDDPVSPTLDALKAITAGIPGGPFMGKFKDTMIDLTYEQYKRDLARDKDSKANCP